MLITEKLGFNTFVGTVTTQPKLANASNHHIPPLSLERQFSSNLKIEDCALLLMHWFILKVKGDSVSKCTLKIAKYCEYR